MAAERHDLVRIMHSGFTWIDLVFWPLNLVDMLDGVRQPWNRAASHWELAFVYGKQEN